MSGDTPVVPDYTYLMYHELSLPGRMPCQAEPGYVRYVVSAEDFAAQMRWLKANRWRGMNVGEAMQAAAAAAVAITFDDGCETDLLVAAPLLKELAFQATFYITYGFLGTRGFMSIEQLRQLSGMGFEIGCHSMTHAYLPDITDAALRREIVDSKLALEDAIGMPVVHFSCPGGRYDRRVVALARQAGYVTVATSETRTNSSSSDPFSLGRVPVMKGLPLTVFEAICRGDGLRKMRLLASVRKSAVRILGNTLYDRLRAALLHGA